MKSDQPSWARNLALVGIVFSEIFVSSIVFMIIGYGIHHFLHIGTWIIVALGLGGLGLGFYRLSLLVKKWDQMDKEG